MSAIQETSAGTNEPVVGASDVIAQSNKHWNVSGTSVLVAWGLAITGGVRKTDFVVDAILTSRSLLCCSTPGTDECRIHLHFE